MKRTLLLSALIFMLAAQISWAQIPETISYQGLLTDASGTVVPDGNYRLTFKLYDVDKGGIPLWTETHLSVAVVKGMFNVILGSLNPLRQEEIPFDQRYWLGVTVGTGQELTPRIELTSSAYSLSARSVADGAITSSKIVNGAVTTEKIAGGAVTSAKLAVPLSLSGSSAAGSAIIAGTNSGNGWGVYGWSSKSYGVRGGSTDSHGVYGTSGASSKSGVFGSNNHANGYGVYGGSTNGHGVHGESTNGHGVYGESTNGHGIHGESTDSFGVYGKSTDGYAVYGQNYNGDGVSGWSTNGIGVRGNSYNDTGVHGESSASGKSGVYGSNDHASGIGVHGWGSNNIGVYGGSTNGYGVYGYISMDGTGTAVHGISSKGYGVRGGSADNYGVYGSSTNSYGVYGSSTNSYGVYGQNASGYEGMLGGSDYGVKSQGDLVVTSGAYRGDIGPNSGAPFPRPAYDSGWRSISSDQNLALTHNIGGDVNNYVVDLQMKDTTVSGSGDIGINNVTGAFWHSLNTVYIIVYRQLTDTACNKVRVRIWVCP